jgi:hypothetical protein
MTRSVSPKARLRGAHLSTPAEQNKVLKIPLVPAEGSRLWRQTNLKPGTPVARSGNHSWLPSRKCFDNAGRGFSLLPALSPGDSVADGETRCDFPPLSRRGMAKSVKLVPQPAIRSVCGAAASGTLAKPCEENRMISQQNISASTPMGERWFPAEPPFASGRLVHQAYFSTALWEAQPAPDRTLTFC